MSDIADMMLDGTLCATCGTFLGEDPPGCPQYCCKACEPVVTPVTTKKPPFQRKHKAKKRKPSNA